MEEIINNTVQNSETQEKSNGCLSSLGGCLIKVILFILAMMALAFVKTCSRNAVRQQLKSQGTEYYQNSNSSSDYSSLSKTEIDTKLEEVMAQMRETLPQQIDPITFSKDVQMDDNYFFYICDLDDAKFDFSTIDMQTLKDNQTKGLKSILPNMKAMVKLLIQTDRGLVYRYHGTTSGAIRDIKFTKEELQNMMEVMGE